MLKLTTIYKTILFGRQKLAHIFLNCQQQSCPKPWFLVCNYFNDLDNLIEARRCLYYIIWPMKFMLRLATSILKCTYLSSLDNCANMFS